MLYPMVRNDATFNRFKWIDVLDLNPGQNYTEFPMIVERFEGFLKQHGYSKLDAIGEKRVHLDLQLVSTLSLDGIGTKQFYAKPLSEVNNVWMFLDGKKTLNVIKKVNCIGLCSWSGDFMEELHRRIASSPDPTATFQLALKIIEKLYVRYLPRHRLFKQMTLYWTLLRNLILSRQIKTRWTRLVVGIFKTFCLRQDVYRDFFRNSLDLCFFFKCVLIEKFPVWGLWRESLIAEVTMCSCFLSTDTRNFLHVLTVGVKSVFSPMLYGKLKAWIIYYYKNDLEAAERKEFNDILNDMNRQRKTFRVLQAYFLLKHNSVKALKLLWCSIPDPFLTSSDFLCLAGNNDFLLVEVLRVWILYERCVIGTTHLVSTPRTLKHLSRCAVRSSLADSFQLPKGIESLFIPRTLHHYLGIVNLNDI
ncbi:uncharacterized protein [Parasteatoda tepidariorum]|uniref:uncharacterized protein n=1 Tax=Parasteatoda tepidariorum TaxID=114398 RepID=UPI001C71C71C|nr:uncharacterized protein LOC107449642 [Parasteatoda tepidariorum]